MVKKGKKKEFNKRVIKKTKNYFKKISPYYFKLPKSKLEDEIAPVWKRFFAFGIDTFLFALIINNPFLSLYFSRLGINSSQITLNFMMSNPNLDNIILTASITSSILFLAYFSTLEGLFSYTFGKYLFRLKVEDSLGRKPSWLSIIIRNLPKILIPVLAIDCIGLLGDKRQRIADIIADTYVVYSPANKSSDII